MELKEAIVKRRTIRRFNDYQITDQELKELLTSAGWAPSWKNTQSWMFIVLRDKEVIAKVADTYSEKNPARNCSLSASAVIIACAKSNLAGFSEGVQTTKHAHWHFFDLGLAVQNLCLQAYELGLGCVIVGSLDHDRCRKILNISSDYEVVVAIPLGRPAAAPPNAPPRKELRSFVYLNKFNDLFI